MEEETDVQATDNLAIGDVLRTAREEKGLSLEELAASTRIPQRHLENIEAGNWNELPSSTYTIGFAKNYAEKVGLDREAVAEDVRAELDVNPRPVRETTTYEVQDEGRSMPRWIPVVAILAIVGAVLVFSYMNDQRLAADEEEVAEADVEPTAQAPVAAAPEPDLADGPVILSASQNVWMRITDGSEVLFARELEGGESFRIPEDTQDPRLETVRPEWLTITVGGREIPQLGEAGARIRDVSLRGPDLQGAAGSSSTPQAGTAPSTASATAPSSADF